MSIRQSYYQNMANLGNKFNIKKGIHISLIKNVPLGSGLGGGSSNAAVTLLAINKLFNLQLSSYEFQSIAESLGSDVPFFLEVDLLIFLEEVI